MIDFGWQPNELIQVGRSADTSTGVTRVLTDAGEAYVKPLGNRQGPHVLATDWVCTQLARWLGLQTFDLAIFELDELDRFPLPRGHQAEPGPALAAKAVSGHVWGRTEEELDALTNPDDLTRLVILDTWLCNCDRYFHDLKARKPNYDNVFIQTARERSVETTLLAIDHGLCVIRSGEDLTPKVSHIAKVKEEKVYGLFPQFRSRINGRMIEASLTRLGQLDRQDVQSLVATIPKQWEVNAETRSALVDFICHRADWVAQHFETWLDELCPWFGEPDTNRNNNEPSGEVNDA